MRPVRCVSEVKEDGMRIPCRGRKCWLFLFSIFTIGSTLVFSQPPNIYTFSGDADLGRASLVMESSGQHYIGARGDTVYVVWQGAGIRCAKSTDGGQTFTPPVTLAYGYNPSMRLDTVGIIYVAYQDDFADIRFTKSTDGGISFTSGIKVNDDTIPEIGQEKPAIAVNNKGQVFIAWNDQRTAPGQPHRAIFSSASHDGGQTFTPNVEVTDTSEPGQINDIAADDSGRVYVLYKGEIIARSMDSGQSFPDRTHISEPPLLLGFTSMAISGPLVGLLGAAGQFVGDSLNINLRFSASTDYGQTFSTSVVVSDTGYKDPSLNWADGIFYLAWRGSHFRPSGETAFDIFFSYSTNTGKTFAVHRQVNSDGFDSHHFASIAANDFHTVFVAWQDARYDPLFRENLHTFVATGNPAYQKGDLNLDGLLSIADVVIELNAIFLNSSFLAPFSSADGNCDGILSPADVVVLLSVVFLGIPFPCS